MISLSDRLQQYLVIRRRCGYDLTASARWSDTDFVDS